MKRRAGLVAGLLGLGLAAPVAAQEMDYTFTVPRSFFESRLPNGGAMSMTIPTGWGAAFQSVFVGGSFVDRIPYEVDAPPDGGFSFGTGLWDPVLFVGLEASVAVADAGSFEDLGLGLKVHRELSPSWAVAAGVENIRLDSDETDFDLQTYYVAVSHGVRAIPLWVTAGVGSGRFVDMSAADVVAGKDEEGTRVFGSVAYQLIAAPKFSANLIGEWNGINLGAGIGALANPFGMPFAISVGLLDLTGYSGDGTRFTISGGLGASLF